jgi:hypothetical protein
MKNIFAVPATVLIALLMLPVKADAQTPPKPSTFTIAGHPGEAQLLQVNGKSYVEVQTLARLTKGTLSFKANRTILTLPPAELAATAPTPPVKTGFSTAFVQASIEELSIIREWRFAIVSSVQNNTPASEDWISEEHRLANKNLALAIAAATTDDDRSASPLLTSEFNHMQELSELYLAIRQQAAFISADSFHSTPLEDQILSCARDFVSMTENHEFQDQTDCH